MTLRVRHGERHVKRTERHQACRYSGLGRRAQRGAVAVGAGAEPPAVGDDLAGRAGAVEADVVGPVDHIRASGVGRKLVRIWSTGQVPSDDPVCVRLATFVLVIEPWAVEWKLAGAPADRRGDGRW